MVLEVYSCNLSPWRTSGQEVVGQKGGSLFASSASPELLNYESQPYLQKLAQWRLSLLYFLHLAT